MEDTLKHFEEKLAKLEKGMWTDEGKRIARERAKKLRIFRGWWDEEAEGRDYLGEEHEDEGEMAVDAGAGLNVNYSVGPADEVHGALDPVVDPRINGMNSIVRESTEVQTGLEGREMGPGEQLMGEMLRMR